MVILVRATGLAAMLLGSISAAHATPETCRERLLPPPAEAATGKRPITARDLVELRDFGRTDSGPAGKPVFSLSPDGGRVAIALRRADPDTDSYCLGIAIVALDGSGGVALVDVGGEYISTTVDARGIPATPTGVPYGVAPLWSPDGKAVFYMRRDKGVTQLWRAEVESGQARPLTRFPIDALSVEWSQDQHRLLVATRPSLAEGELAIQREGRRGYHFDGRFSTLFESKPRPPLPLPQQISAIDPVSGEERILSNEEAASMRSKANAAQPKEAILFAASGGGGRAWTARDGANPYNAPAPLHVEFGGVELPCPAEICSARVAAIWWRGPDELYILRGGGADDAGRLALYRWNVRSEPRPRLLFQTDAALLNCLPWRDALLCGAESSTQPRRLVRVETSSGRMTPLFDPNPEFAGLRLGSVERLRWRNAQGMQTYGDLVLPPNHHAGERHPLIVVQYTSNGFLRGGTGDDYPIFLLAGHGFAVLSFQRPAALRETYRTPDVNAAQRINIAGYAERRTIFSSLLTGVDAAIARGAVDPKRLGISGMSDGATTTQFTLNNSTRFKAAAISSCCDEPSWLFVVGPAYRDAALSWGYPKQATDGEAFWKPMSLSVNAATMRTPLLIQVPDAEYRGALETFSALQQHGAPIDMYVFPGEYHVKSSPAHRLAIYDRAVGWFEFWLFGAVKDSAGLSEEILRWEELRRAKPQN